MGKSNNARGPDFKVLRIDLENARRACKQKVLPLYEEEDIGNLLAVDTDSTENCDQGSDTSIAWVDPELRKA